MSTSSPKATTNPTWNSDSSGSAISTLKVAASTRPALVITPPVRSSAVITACRVVAAPRPLLADARQQEDVVVHPQRDQEDERELLEGLVARRLTHHVREDRAS